MVEMTTCGDPARRHDFILVFDVSDGNPNGDPDAGNMPRVDPETNQGLVTDVCIKRKVRNYVTLAKQDAGFGIYVNDQGVALNTLHQQAYDEQPAIKSTGTKQKREEIATARERMCRRFYDVRMFGAVMTTGVNCGQVRGPVQLTFARSVDHIVPLEVSITRVAITKPEDAQFETGEDGKEGKRKVTEMGNKAIVPYGLYVAHGFYSPPFALQTGVTRDDLELFWSALMLAWDLDHSASRGRMACHGLYVFSHDNPLGNAPAHQLFSRFDARLKSGVETAREYGDYAVAVNGAGMPTGVTLTQLVATA